MTCLIMCAGLTSAQRLTFVLERSGVGAYVVRPPQNLTSNGCSYAVTVKNRQLQDALKVMRENRLPIRKVFCKKGDGYREAPL